MPFFLKIVFGFVIFKFPPFAIIGTFVESYLCLDLLSSIRHSGQVAKNSSRPVICKGLLQTLAPGLFPTQSVSRLPHRLRLAAGRALKSFGKRENRTLMKVWILNEISHLTLWRIPGVGLIEKILSCGGCPVVRLLNVQEVVGSIQVGNSFWRELVTFQ